MLFEFISKLAKDLELKEPLAQGEGAGEDSFTLLLDTTPITIREAQNGFQFSALLGEPPQEQLELFYSKMLRGNLFGQATNGSTLGIDEPSGQIILRYYAPQKASYRDFKERLEDFINTCDFWHQEAKSHQVNPLAA